MAGHVFLSFSRIDEIYARRLATHLRHRGVEVWLVGGDDEDGDRWAHETTEKVDTCAVFVPVMTPESQHSDRVGQEIARARESQRPIMPVLLAGRPFDHLAEVEDVVGRRMPTDEFVARLRELAPGEFIPPPQPPPAAGARQLVHVAGAATSTGAANSAGAATSAGTSSATSATDGPPPRSGTRGWLSRWRRPRHRD